MVSPLYMGELCFLTAWQTPYRVVKDFLSLGWFRRVGGWALGKAQTHVHRVGDAIQPSHPLSSPSPPAPNPSQHHSLFQ